LMIWNGPRKPQSRGERRGGAELDFVDDKYTSTPQSSRKIAVGWSF
jgi:hypothetical protein